MDGWMIHQMVFYSYFFVSMGKMQLLWLRVMMPVIRKSLKAALFVSHFFELISFFNIFFFKNFFLIEAKPQLHQRYSYFFSLSANYWFPVDNERNFPPV